MYFSPRLLQVEDQKGALRELLRLGIDPALAHRLAADATRGVLRLSAVPPPLVEGLRHVSEPLNGLEVIASSGKSSAAVDILLIGSFPQLGRLVEGLKADPLTKGLSDDLSSLLKVEPPCVLRGRSCRLLLNRPLIMGVLNATPDSFFSGARCESLDDALRHAALMAAQGADLIDVGGESTRPGAVAVSEEEELHRVVPLIEALKREVDTPLSIDTIKSRVAHEAVAAGADFINDISGFRFDPQMAATAASSGAGVFLMHTRGRPDRMQEDTHYADLVGEILGYLHESLALSESAGIPPERTAIDPGIGFGKSVEGNLEILRRLREFASLGRPILLGTSRKGFIGKVLDRQDPAQRLFGTLATVALGVAEGANIFRVHDVEAAREAAMMAWAVRHGG